MKQDRRKMRLSDCLSVVLLIGLLTSCASAPPTKAPLVDNDLIPLPYPHADMGVGALRWGDPKGAATSMVDARTAFSQKFRDARTAKAIQFEDFKRKSGFGFNLGMSPGPQVLAVAQGASAKASLGLSNDSLKHVGWGELSETTVDLQTLSEACVRGWCDLHGEALANKVLFQMALDQKINPARPWVVTRSVEAKGMKYEVTSGTDFSFNLGASQPLYGSGEVGFAYKVLNERTLQVNQPMVIGYDAAFLESVEPPMPKISQLVGDYANGYHSFNWKLRESNKRVSITVDLKELKIRDARNAAETNYVPSVVTGLVDQVKKGQPVPTALIGEVHETNGWRTLSEGGTFVGNALVRLRVIMDEPGFLYVYTKDGKGQAAVLYPKVEGESLSAGEEKLIPKGEWSYPVAVNGDDGLKYDPAEAKGTESFVVIASKTKLTGLPKAMSDFARAASKAASSNASASQGDLALGAILRLPVNTAKLEAKPATPEAQAKQEEPLFSGLGTATVLKLNLNRVPVK